MLHLSTWLRSDPAVSSACWLRHDALSLLFEGRVFDFAGLRVAAMRDERRLRELVIRAYNGGGAYVAPWAQARYEPTGEVTVRGR